MQGFRIILVFIITTYAHLSFASDSNSSKGGSKAKGAEVIAESLIQEDVLHMSEQRAVAYKYIKAQKGQPTVVLLNGWIYPLRNWDSYVKEISDKGYGVVVIAYSTQSESLRYLKEKPYYEDIRIGPTGYMYHKGIETKDLADDVLAVVDELGLDKFHVQTLSYGSIVGSYLANHHAERLETITLITPVVIPSQRYTPYGEARHVYYVWQNEINMNPFYIPDHYYDLEVYQSLRLVMEIGKAQLDLEGIGFETFLNGVFQMGRSSKYFDLKDEAGKVWPKTFLVLASDEEAMLLKDQMNYWKLKKADAPETAMVLVQGAPHAIPSAFPSALVAITDHFLNNQNVSGSFTFNTLTNGWNNQDQPEDILKSCGYYLSKSGYSSTRFGLTSSF